MEREGDVMLELCDLAFITNMHADALECAVDDTRSTLAHMQNEESTLREWEEQLRELFEHKKRIDALRSLVHRAKSERESSLASIQLLQRQQQQQKQQSLIKSKQITNKNKHDNNGNNKIEHARTKNRLQENENYTNYNRQHSPSPSLISSENQQDTFSVNSQANSAIDDQINELQKQISTLHANSIKTKLLKLEEAKRRVQESHAAERVAALLYQYAIPTCVTEMWGHCDNTNSKTNNNGITKHNVDDFVHKAAERYANRYANALHVLCQANLTTQSDWREVMEFMLYAQELDTDHVDRVRDMETVEYLQREHFAKQQESNKECKECNQRKCSHMGLSSEKSIAEHHLPEPTQTPLLSRFDFCALPPSWPEVQQLTHITEHNLLPPARHILTKRFSFANVDEFMALQHLRVQIQRVAIQRIFNKLPKIVPTYLSHCTSRECAVALLRLTALTHSLAKECESILNEHGDCCITAKEQFNRERKESLTDNAKSTATHGRSNAWLTLVSTDRT